MNEQTERLKSTISDVSPSRKEISAELRADEVARELASILDHYAGRARLKGFRAGKAPKDMVKQVYSHDIHHALVDSLVPKVLEEILSIHHIHPAGSPVIDDLTFEEGQPLKFKATVEVWPDFVVPAYRKIKVTRKAAVVDEADIDKTVEDLRRKAAEYVPVEGRGVIADDYVVIELQGRDLKTKRMRPAEKAVILAGHPGNEPAVNENVLGLEPGGSRTFRQAYPADAPNKALAGREMEYTLKVASIKAQKLAEVNDDFAKSLGEYADLADLREKIRQELLRTRQAAGRREAVEEAVRQLLEQTSIELPSSAVEEEEESILHKAAEQLAGRGVTPQLVEEWRPRAHEQAVLNLKRNLLLRKIAERESLTVSEDETDQEIRLLAQANNVPVPRMMEVFGAEGRREGLRAGLILRKAVDFLADQAIMD